MKIYSPRPRAGAPFYDAPIHGRALCSIAAAALFLRAIIFTLACLHGHISLNAYARLYDGNSYLITARAMTSDTTEFTDYHGRVFPGYPALIALIHCLGVPFTQAAIGIDWVSAALAAVLAAIVFRDLRIGWAMVMLIPHYLMNSAMALSEAPLLAFTLGAILLLQKAKSTAGGLLFGFAGFIRPMACFAMLGSVIAELYSPQLPTSSDHIEADASVQISKTLIRITATCVAAAVALIAGLLLLHAWRGDALASARYQATATSTYGGNLLTWPFHALLTVPHERHVPLARVAYIWSHALVVLIACGALLHRVLENPRHLDPRDALAAPWLWANTLFILCIGSIWGFECFHRFTIPAQPAMFWAVRRILPRRPATWMLLAILCTAVAALTAMHDLDPVPQLAKIAAPN